MAMVLTKTARISIYTQARLKSSIPSSASRALNSNVDPENLPFGHAKTGGFTQTPPRHSNGYLSDGFLRRSLNRLIPTEALNGIQLDLIRFAESASNEVWKLGEDCENNPPTLRQTNAWGERVDEVVTCPAWKEQKSISAREGMIAIAYEREHGKYSRIHQAVKLGLYSPAAGLYTCPLAMTDGATKTIEANDLKDQLAEPFRHLTSRDPHQFWTSGQWMTEKRGGSDVGQGTETLAVPQVDGSFKLYGYKWFSSATDSNMTLTLARIVDDNGEAIPGSRGISMFYLPTRTDEDKLNGIQVVKLKNKLGTRQLPTGELLLDGASAQLISTEGRGIPSITSMLTITRMHNVISSVCKPRKLLQLSRDYATRRIAFGKSLSDHPLHMQTLARLESEVRGCTALTLDLARQLGLDDTNELNDRDQMLLRLFMPVAKMYTGKMTMSTLSEGLESFGGQGYIEDTGMPGMLRDNQVLPIWEGTSNVMSLDVLRAIAKSSGEVIKALFSKVSEISKAASNSNSPDIKAAGQAISQSLQETVGFLEKESGLLEVAARDLTFSLAHIYITTLLTEHCLDAQNSDKTDIGALKYWLNRDLAPVVTNFKNGSYAMADEYNSIVYDGYDEKYLYGDL